MIYKNTNFTNNTNLHKWYLLIINKIPFFRIIFLCKFVLFVKFVFKSTQNRVFYVQPAENLL